MQRPPAPSNSEAHHRGQAAMADLVAEMLRRAWPLLDPTRIQETIHQFLAAVKAIIHKYGHASASAALRYYDMERDRAGILGRSPQLIAPGPSDEVMRSAVEWGIADLRKAHLTEAMFPGQTEADMLDGHGLSDPVFEAQQRVEEAVARLVLNQGRHTVLMNVQDDTKAKGWSRLALPGACYFCAMLATRGMVYRSRKSASFEAHDHCRCQPEPVFTQYEPSAQVREWTQLWKQSTRDQRGPRNMRIAFRQAIEGRPVTGPTNRKSP